MRPFVDEFHQLSRSRQIQQNLPHLETLDHVKCLCISPGATSFICNPNSQPPGSPVQSDSHPKFPTSGFHARSPHPRLLSRPQQSPSSPANVALLLRQTPCHSRSVPCPRLPLANPLNGQKKKKKATAALGRRSQKPLQLGRDGCLRRYARYYRIRTYRRSREKRGQT